MNEKELENFLRKELMDYYGTAKTNGNPMAVMELEEARNASLERLKEMAEEIGIKVTIVEIDDGFER